MNAVEDDVCGHKNARTQWVAKASSNYLRINYKERGGQYCFIKE